jgi:outer membrane protein assembly factor BamB
MRPALLLSLVLTSMTASCTAGPPLPAGHAVPVATWTDRLSGGAAVQALATDPATGALIELQSAPTNPAQPDTSAVLGLDPATGRQLWSTLTGNQQPTAAMPDKDLLAIATNTPSVWVLDARSGTEERNIDIPGTDQVTGLAGGNIIATDTSGSNIAAFSLVSGRETWHRSTFGGCPVGGAATGGTVVGVLVNCPGNQILLVGADPATGRELWSRPVNRNFDQTLPDQPLSAGVPVTLTANGHLFGVSSTAAVSLYTDTGRLLDSEPTQQYSRPWFTTSGSQALLIYQSLTGYLTVKKIGIETSATRTLLREPYVLGPVASSGGVAYIDATAPEPLLPTLLIALNERTGSFGVSALPFAGPASYYSLATTSDEVIVIPSSPEPSLIAAYRFPPLGASAAPQIRGGAPGQWPAACSLVRASAIARHADGPYVAVPRPLRADADGPDASTCEFVPSRAGLPLVTVSVVWRAPGTAQAGQLLRNATAGWTKIAGMEDPAYQNAETSPGEVLMRAGNTIVEIKVSGTPRAQNALANSVARQVEAGP